MLVFPQLTTGAVALYPVTKQGLQRTVVNVLADGRIKFNRNVITPQDLQGKLDQLSKLYPDQAVILRGDQKTDYKSIVDVLDICRKANIWNVAFATAKQE